MAACGLLSQGTANAQQPAPTAPAPTAPAPTAPAPTAPAQETGTALRPNYVLGPDDQILIRASDAEELSDKPYRIDESGILNLPLVGRIRAGGLTVSQFEGELKRRLSEYVRSPQVIVSVVQFRSDPVFVVGALRNPGIYPLQGRRSLVEVLTAAGGLMPNAGRTIKVTRRLDAGVIPLPNTEVQEKAGVSSIEINMSRLMESVNPAEDLELEPFDIVSVPVLEMVYVSGEVGRPGAFEMNGRDSISVTQLISLAGGAGREAALEQVKVLRQVMGTSKRAEIPLNIDRIFKGSSNDFPLMPNDVLVIPRAGGGMSRALRTGLMIVLPPLVTAAIYLGLN